MNKEEVIGILSADYHLSHNPPVWRSNEPDWYAAMQRPLDEIQSLSEMYDCPVFCAGDILDRWDSPAELINFAIENLPCHVYAIPGQHEVPNHNLREMKRSAYKTLCKNKITDLPELQNIASQEIFVWSFPYGTKIKSEKRKTKFLKIAIVHDYVWTGNYKYKGAPESKHVENHSSKLINGKLYGYDVIVYGDNHKGFLVKVGKTTIFNCGTLMRRKSDEEKYRPQVGLLYSDGSVKPYYLDISKDKHLTAEEAKQKEKTEELDMDELAKELRKLGSSALDLSEAINQYCKSKGINKLVRNIINKAMEKKK